MGNSTHIVFKYVGNSLNECWQAPLNKAIPSRTY